MPQNHKVLSLIEKLINDAKSLTANPFIVTQDDAFERGQSTRPYIPDPSVSDTHAFNRWSNEIVLLEEIAGEIIKPWRGQISTAGDEIWRVKRTLAALETIKFAIDTGLLNSFEDLVIADTFADLMEQGRYLLGQGYFLAAGVIFRAVLEERLRKLCDRNSCVPAGDRPTINDYNMSLYKATPPVYNRNMMLHITAIAAIGNDAAHNKPSLKDEDVERLAVGVEDFLARYS